MKILSVKQTTSELSRVGRRVHPTTGFAISGGRALLVEIDGELERCARVSTARGTWTVLAQAKPTELLLLATTRALHVGDELRIGVVPATPKAPSEDLMARAASPAVPAKAEVAAAVPVKRELAKPKTDRKKSGLFGRLAKEQQK